MRSEPQKVWTGFVSWWGGVGALVGSKPCLRGKDQAGGEQYVPQPALGVILDCDLPPQALSSFTVSFNVYASVLP